VLRTDRLAVGCLVASVALLVSVGALGTSPAVPPLGAVSWLPPYSLDIDPAPVLVVALQVAGLLIGGTGLALALVALRRGWQPQVQRLLVGSAIAVVAFVLVRPMGSADVLSYAAYGRIAALGGDPYDVAPDEFAAATGDPVAGAVQEPWRSTTSVYGPLGTLLMRSASMIGGPSVRVTVLALAVVGALAYLATAVLLDRLAGPSIPQRARAALLWAVNPVLLYELVGGVHLDVEAVALGVAALLLAARGGVVSACAAGGLVGAAAAVKAPLGLYGIALLAPLIFARDLRRAVALVVGGLLVVVPAYLLAGPHVFDQTREAARLISRASPWNLIRTSVDEPLGLDASRPLVGTVALVAAIAIVVLLLWATPTQERLHPPRLAFVLSAGWLLTALYSLPWYDAMLFAPLAAVAATPFDGPLVTRLTVLALAYVPGRVLEEAPLPPWLAELTGTWRSLITPVLLLGVIVVVVVRAIVVSEQPSRRARNEREGERYQ
jgi:Glycosyltransferase family 87